MYLIYKEKSEKVETFIDYAMNCSAASRGVSIEWSSSI